MSNTDIDPTSGGHVFSSQSQTNYENFRQKTLDEWIGPDIKQAVKCPYDRLLKAFLYLVLKDDSEEKKAIDDLQMKIETIQWDRYYKTESLDSKGGETGDATMVDDDVLEQGRQETAEDDVEKNGTEEERRMALRRDAIISKVFTGTLEQAFNIANDADVKSALIEFFGDAETNRYTPFADLCNTVLGKLKSRDLIHITIPLRDADELDIQFLRNDPRRIVSFYRQERIKVEWVPDIIISSTAALSRLKGQALYNHESEQSLPNLSWSSVLSTVNFTVLESDDPEGTISDLNNHVYKLENTHHKLQEISSAQIDSLVDSDTTTASTDGQNGSDTGSALDNPGGSKRDHDTALGPDEGYLTAKKICVTEMDPEVASSPLQEVVTESDDWDSFKGRVRSVAYALEMLSYGAGVHHVVNLLFDDGILWVWYYDRQGIIQSTGISIFRDFPRFIVLLLAFQRFSLQDWGIIPSLNPEAVCNHSPPCPPRSDEQSAVNSMDKEQNDAAAKNVDTKMTSAPLVDIDLRDHLANFKYFSSFWRDRKQYPVVHLSHVQLKTKEYLSDKPHCIAGRATAVVPATGYGERGDDKVDLVCKIYHPEVQRRHEGLTMEVIYSIAANEETQAQLPEGVNAAKMNILNHLPHLYFHGEVKGTTTHRIRSMINQKWKGHRTMRIIGMKKLQKVTVLSGWDFVKAWLEGVICHAFLWKNYIEHGDPSDDNLMYDPETGSGVLTDFDLSFLQWEHHVSGTDTTGTVPFMALDLLTERYWKGQVKRYYHHELESFVWILPYVFLLYQDGQRHHNTEVDSWITDDVDKCYSKKFYFYCRRLRKVEPMVQPDFRPCWFLAEGLCLTLRNHAIETSNRRREACRANANVQTEKADLHYVRNSEDLWHKVHECMSEHLQSVSAPDFAALLKWFEYYKPSFLLSEPEAECLRNTYRPILDRAWPAKWS